MGHLAIHAITQATMFFNQAQVPVFKEAGRLVMRARSLPSSELETPTRVSIIISNYNYGRFVEAAINSALSQTYPYCEVIVVDDGSTDQSRDVIRKFESRTVIILQNNCGQSAALNKGFAQCSGDLVAFLDSDDLLDTDAIRRIVLAWKPDYSKIQFPLRIIDAEGVPNGLVMPTVALSEGDVRSELLSTGYYITSPTSGNVFSRAFLSRVMPMPEKGFPHGNGQECALPGDSYLSIHAAFWGNIGSFQRALGAYRVHGTNMSGAAITRRVNLAQVEKLIGHGLRQQDLIRRIAGEMDIQIDPHVLESHWFYLKLLMARQKLGGPHSGTSSLWRTGALFIRSVSHSCHMSTTRDLCHCSSKTVSRNCYFLRF